MRFDLHVHTTLSPCSKLDIQDVLTHARILNLDGVCITDHDTMGIRKYIQEGIQEDGLCVIFGMEYTSLSGDFLIFGPFEKLAPGLSDIELLETVNNAGGVAIAAHPFRPGRSVREKIFKTNLCYIAEGINGRNSEIANLKVHKLHQQYGIVQTGGSDAHTLEELGHVTTCFSIPVKSRSDLIFALQNGLCFPEINPAWSGCLSGMKSVA